MKSKNADKKSARVKRVEHYEELFDKLSGAVANYKAASEELKGAEDAAKELDSYISGGKWLKDYTDDEAGLFPDGMKRGVLSQDALYDLLGEYEEICGKIR